MTIDDDKAQARKQAFAARKAVHGTGRDAAAQEALRSLLAPWHDAALAGYMPIRTEIDPLPVMAGHGASGAVPVGVPVILGPAQPLVFHRWTPGCAMIDGAFGARIPAVAEPVVPRVVIVPMVGFDARGFRLGYGGGFYDRTLAQLRTAGPVLAVGFAFDAQELPEVPIDRFDQRLDAVVTESGPRLFGG